MAMDYNDWPQGEGDTFEGYIQDEPYEEPPLDESVLTPDQRMELDELFKENPMLTRSNLAKMIRLNLMSYRATLEGRELTFFEIMVAQDLQEVVYWVPPFQLQGICDLTFEFQDYEDSHMLCVGDIAYDLSFSMLIDECYDLICETQRLDTLRIEKFARDYHEICFDISYLCTLNDHDLKFNSSMLEESRSFLAKSDLGDEFDVDKILTEIENPKVEKDDRNDNVLFYMIDGDEVNYFVTNLFKPKVDFIFPPNAFDSPEHATIKEFFKVYGFVVDYLDENIVYFLWKVVCIFAHFVSYPNRRRTKGALAQPFDSHD